MDPIWLGRMPESYEPVPYHLTQPRPGSRVAWAFPKNITTQWGPPSLAGVEHARLNSATLIRALPLLIRPISRNDKRELIALGCVLW